MGVFRGPEPQGAEEGGRAGRVGAGALVGTEPCGSLVLPFPDVPWKRRGCGAVLGGAVAGLAVQLMVISGKVCDFRFPERWLVSKPSLPSRRASLLVLDVPL